MPSFSVVTFGCQMNQHDSERLEQVLRRAGGWSAADAEDAEVVVVNSCSVRDKARQKLFSELGRLAIRKRSEPAMLLVVAGCVAQQEGERILAALPAVDLVIGPDNIPELPDLLAELRLGGPRRALTTFDVDEPRFLTAPRASAGKATAYVTTMKGCNERCSFCVVPETRGPERYRPSDSIVAEVAELVASGVREVTLLGQTVNSYRDPSGRLGSRAASVPDPDEGEFALLLRRIAAEVPTLRRLRYTSPHPRHLTGSLTDAHRDLALLCRHVHLPVQSGSDAILRRMIRRHGRAEYLERVGRLRREVASITLSTDIIVGFPGETEADFVATLSLVAEVGFVGVFGFKYSPRPGTAALRLGDDVPEPVKSERLARLFALSEALGQRHLASLVGSRQEVLVEGTSKTRPENLTGRTARNEIVHIAGADGLDLGGELVEVQVLEALKHSLLARLGDDDRRRARPRRPTESARRRLPLASRAGG